MVDTTGRLQSLRGETLKEKLNKTVKAVMYVAARWGRQREGVYNVTGDGDIGKYG